MTLARPNFPYHLVHPAWHPTALDESLVGFVLDLRCPFHGKFIQPDIGDKKGLKTPPVWLQIFPEEPLVIEGFYAVFGQGFS